MSTNNFFPSEDDIFHKFSDSAQKILTHSQRIARDMGSGINSEHLLLALTATPGTIAYELLHDHLINIDQIRLILSLRGRETTLQSGMSPYAKHILEMAAEFAHQYHHVHIDAEHILLGIASFPESLAYQIIARIGVDPKTIKNQIVRLFEELSRMDQKVRPDFIMETDGPPLTNQPHQHTDHKQKKNSLEYFATNLTDEAASNKLDPVVGRENEMQRLIQVLARRTKNNPVLVGDPGVGKTAIIEGLAQKIVSGDVPPILKDKQLFQLDLALLIAGTTYRGQFEERLKKVMQEVKKNPNIILFIDEIHTIVGAGSAEGSMDAANILKPSLAKGEVRLIGATTTEEYRKHIEKDAALERRMQKIVISEPTVDETVAILRGLRKTYEKYHHVSIADEALEAAALYGQRFIQDRFLPDKAIDLIDEAASAIQLARVPKQPTGLREWKKELADIVAKKEAALEARKFEEAAALRQKEMTFLKTKPATKTSVKKEIITEENIAKVVTAWTGIPVGNILKEEQERLRNLEKTLKQHVIGQDEAIKAIASAIRRSKAGISNPSRPLGSFLFMGPTGVGKTYLTQVLAKTVYGSESALIKVDMSEFMERHTVARLVGAPPGYVGYDEGGKLTESIRRQPFSVVLFDEIEKAHPDVFNILLQILEDGKLTDGTGRVVTFRHAIIILTSNIGSERLTRQAAIGFNTKDFEAKDAYIELKDNILDELKHHFRPELINRLDKIVVFEPLGKKEINAIIENELQFLKNRLAAEHFYLDTSKKAIDLLAEKGFDPNFGVRPLRRAIAELLEDALADLLLSGTITRGSTLLVDVKNEELTITPKKAAKQQST